MSQEVENAIERAITNLRDHLKTQDLSKIHAPSVSLKLGFKKIKKTATPVGAMPVMAALGEEFEDDCIRCDMNGCHRC